jgi:hypothetical protein
VPQSRSGCGDEEKNSQPPPGIEPLNPNHPAHSLVATLTELSWFLKHEYFRENTEAAGG